MSANAQLFSIEVVVPEDSSQTLKDRIEMPLFFIVGGADDIYLSQLVEQPIVDLVKLKSVDEIPPKPFVVYGSRSLLPTFGYVRTFPLNQLLEKQWPILLDVTKPAQTSDGNNLSTQHPSDIEKVWIIRALRRAGKENLAEQLKTRMLKDLYPKKLTVDRIPISLDVSSLSRLYSDLSSQQKQYPLIIIKEDLPIQLPKKLGDALAEITLTGCLSGFGVDGNLILEAIKTSLDLLKI